MPSIRRRVQGHHGRPQAVVALHQREALASLAPREGQASAACRLPLHLLVRPVDEPDDGRVRESKHDGVAVSANLLYGFGHVNLQKSGHRLRIAPGVGRAFRIESSAISHTR